LLGAAQRRNHVETSAFVFRAKCDLLPVGRPVRLPVVSRRMSDLHRVPPGYGLDPDVELTAPVGAVSDKAPVRRPGGAELQPGVKRQAGKRPLRQRTWLPRLVIE